MEIQLRTPEDELARVWLNNPKFITTVDRGDRLLMFFREEIPSQNPEIKRKSQRNFRPLSDTRWENPDQTCIDSLKVNG